MKTALIVAAILAVSTLLIIAFFRWLEFEVQKEIVFEQAEQFKKEGL